MATIWEQIEYLKYEIAVATRNKWDKKLAGYLQRLQEVEKEAEKVAMLRCDSVCVDADTKIVYRCTRPIGHKQGTTKPKRIKHVSFSFQWTDEGVKHRLALEEKARLKKQAIKTLPLPVPAPVLLPQVAVIQPTPIQTTQPTQLPQSPQPPQQPKKSSRTSKQQRGDAQEVEILQRLTRFYPYAVRTNINAMGVDVQCKPDLDVQSKAFNCVGPKDISHFADSSSALIKMLVAMSFSKQAKIRAATRNVTLLTIKEFRDRYPLLEETK